MRTWPPFCGLMAAGLMQAMAIGCSGGRAASSDAAAAGSGGAAGGTAGRKASGGGSGSGAGQGSGGEPGSGGRPSSGGGPASGGAPATGGGAGAGVGPGGADHFRTSSVRCARAADEPRSIRPAPRHLSGGDLATRASSLSTWTGQDTDRRCTRTLHSTGPSPRTHFGTRTRPIVRTSIEGPLPPVPRYFQCTCLFAHCMCHQDSHCPSCMVMVPNGRSCTRTLRWPYLTLAEDRACSQGH